MDSPHIGLEGDVPRLAPAQSYSRPTGCGAEDPWEMTFIAGEDVHGYRGCGAWVGCVLVASSRSVHARFCSYKYQVGGAPKVAPKCGGATDNIPFCHANANDKSRHPSHPKI